MYQFPMYFPDGFSLTRARELATLVVQAYSEFSESQGPTASTGGATTPAPPFDLPALGYTDVVLLSGTIRWSPRVLAWIARKVGLPPWVVPGKSVTERFGFVARRGDDVCLVFRGTKTRIDWWEDLHVEQAPLPDDLLPKDTAADWRGSAVEEGVLRLYVTMRQAILAALKEYAPPRRVYVAGHSLGACLALLAVPDLMANTQFRGVSAPIVYNFGQPRFVNHAFARACARDGGEVFRVVHTDDVVTSLMPAVPVLWFANWRHHLFYSHTGVPVDFTVTPGADVPDREALLMANHAMATYQAALLQDVADPVERP